MGELSRKVGKRIKEIRESLKIKQYELAEILDMEPSNLTRIESGYQLPKEDNISKIANALGVKEKDLFDFNETFSKEELIKNIASILDSSNVDDIELVYKFIRALKQRK